MQANQTWGEQGYPAYTGYAWYRLQIDVGPGPQSAILIPPVDDTYEVFWNGIKIGAYGAMPPNARLLNAQHAALYKLPLDGTHALHGTLALRVWKSQLASNDPSTLGGLNAAPVLGDPHVLDIMRTEPESRHSQVFFLRTIVSSVVVIAGLISLLIYLRGGRKPIYLWLSMYLLTDSLAALVNIFCWYTLTLYDSQIVNAGRSVLCNLALWFILLHLFNMAQQPRWRRITLLLFYIGLALQIVDCTAIYLWQYPSRLLTWLDGLTTAGYTLIPAYLFVLLAYGLKRRSRIVFWPLAVSLSAYGLYQIVIDATTQGARFTGLNWGLLDQWTFSMGGYPVGIRVLLDIFFLACLLVTVERRQKAEREQQNTLEQEIKSAREVQRLLVPSDMPSLPGFLVSAVYHPAQEVGGDFFQILPAPDGGMLVVLGDVSGKGLKAAMTVSLIVGAIRTLADTMPSPSQILASLNHRLVGGIAEGFATCLALLIEADGQVTAANAGHLSPFLNRQELVMEGSVPLGIIEGLGYDEAKFQLEPGDRLTLFTDGLLEAQSQAGELYGFERVNALMNQLPAVERMLQVAVAFGQQDDITVLAVTRTLTPLLVTGYSENPSDAALI